MSVTSFVSFLLVFSQVIVVHAIQDAAETTTTTTTTTCEVNTIPNSSSISISSPQKKKLSNSAFVFVKPHANTPATRDLVVDQLTKAGIQIVEERDMDGVEIDQRGLIDQHYYSIASKATILPAEDIPVPVDKFEEAFGESWATVLNEKRACNAMEACERFDCSPNELNDAWQMIETVKFGGGFYCGTYCTLGYIYSMAFHWNNKAGCYHNMLLDRELTLVGYACLLSVCRLCICQRQAKTVCIQCILYGYASQVCRCRKFHSLLCCQLGSCQALMGFLSK
jgi:hypothetical protein